MDQYLAIIQTILDRCDDNNTSPSIDDMEIIKNKSMQNNSDSLWNNSVMAYSFDRKNPECLLQALQRC